MQLYFTDVDVVSRPLSIGDLAVNVVAGALGTAERAGLIEGMPFILMDDGSYDLHLNRFFRVCPGMGARSPNTWRSYAHDILVWARFSQRAAGPQDGLAGRPSRRAGPFTGRGACRTPRSESRRRAGTAALRHSISFIGGPSKKGSSRPRPSAMASPFAGQLARAPCWPLRRTGARERAARQHDMRYVDLGRYLLFRDVGLRGRSPDGTDDPTWRGRNGERNALFRRAVGHDWTAADRRR